jgi:hypothetical protein
MAFLTRAQVRAQAGVTSDLANLRLRESARAPTSDSFDVFLSHAHLDAQEILGVQRYLEAEGLTVYVDWLVDPQLDRARVTPATAARLRERMNRCGYLLYASSRASSDSKWMPWELGYFDGRRGRVGILPIVSSPGESFRGVEYLGLYPVVELSAIAGGPARLRIREASGSNPTVASLARARR